MRSASDQIKALAKLANADADQDGDDETCGFCIFMKAGGCKDEFKVCVHAAYLNYTVQLPEMHMCTGLEQVCR